jgi:N-acetylneuraminic acid mutarotase
MRSIRLLATVALSALIVIVLADVAASQPTAASWFKSLSRLSSAGPPLAVTLASGKVLFVDSGHSDLYDPATGRFAPIPGEIESHNSTNATATLLRNGKVLIMGDDASASTSVGANQVVHAESELYDPQANRFTRLDATLDAGRSGMTATLLPSGKVLFVGGLTGATHGDGSTYFVYNRQTMLFDPQTSQTSYAAPLLQARAFHSATSLADGKVLVAGGCGLDSRYHFPCYADAGYANSSELYDPRTNTWSPAGRLQDARAAQSAVALRDGRVLVAGGYQDVASDMSVLSSAEIYNPGTQGWSSAGRMSTARWGPAAGKLPNGQVLVAGGCGSAAPPRSSPNSILAQCQLVYASADLYDPVAARWSSTAPLGTARFRPGAAMAGGRLLVAGGSHILGQGGSSPAFEQLSTAELYTLAGPGLSGLRLTPTAFSGTRAGSGTTVAYRLSEPARTTFTISAASRGVLSHGRCVAPGLGARGPACTRLVPVASFVGLGASGNNTARFTAHVGRTRLAPRTYELDAVPYGVTGSRGAQSSARFSVTR